jgi:hypothetical protein
MVIDDERVWMIWYKEESGVVLINCGKIVDCVKCEK